MSAFFCNLQKISISFGENTTFTQLLNSTLTLVLELC